MKKAILISPCSAALLFTIPEAWELIRNPSAEYIPVVYELLLFLFGYIAAFVINLVIVLPLAMLLRLKSSSILAGFMLSLSIAFIGTTVAYAFEIFEYQSSILHPAYLYPLLIPLFVMSLMTFFFLTRAASQPAVIPEKQQDSDSSEEDS